MKKNFIPKYKYYTDGHKVICVSSYAGKSVKGVAKCDPKDNFDLDKGKQLAKLRCDYKVAIKRMKRARAKFKEAKELKHDIDLYYLEMLAYNENAINDFFDLKEELKDLEQKM